MRRITFTAFSLALLVAIFGTIGLAETKSDYDHHYKLAAGSTWGFQSQQNTAKDAFGKNTLWDQRVREDLSMDLRSAGLKPAIFSSPDLLVSYHLTTQQGHETEVFSSGYPGFYGSYGFGRFGYRRGFIGVGPVWGPGWGPTTVLRIPEQKSTLVMDVYDAHTHQLVWRGYDTKAIDYNKADNRINDAVEHLTKRFEHDLKLQG